LIKDGMTAASSFSYRYHAQARGLLGLYFYSAHIFSSEVH